MVDPAILVKDEVTVEVEGYHGSRTIRPRGEPVTLQVAALMACSAFKGGGLMTSLEVKITAYDAETRILKCRIVE